MSVHKQRGFSLLEIMVVVGIIVSLATIAVLSFLRSRMTANQMTAITACRVISNACFSYYNFHSPNSYPENLTDLIPPVSDPPYIDIALSSGIRQGYTFNYTATDPEAAFTLNANPLQNGITGTRFFFVDESGIIRSREGSQAEANDPPISG